MKTNTIIVQGDKYVKHTKIVIKTNNPLTIISDLPSVFQFISLPT